jgi:general secretion pathway protein G
MSRMSSESPRRGFTLVEVLIVVVILGVLAAIVIPQFTSASQETQSTATLHEVQKLRRHIGVYRARNNQQLPTVTEGDGTWGEIIGANYLQSAPGNPWIGGAFSQRIRFGSGPDTTYPVTQDYGWIYNTTTGEVWAAGFNGLDQPLARP